MRIPIKDHLGNEYPSITKMCDAYGISSSLYHARIKLGKSVEEALTLPLTTTPGNAKQIIDHEGNVFKSVSAMCEHWGMTRVTYNARIRMGWSIKDALTKDKKAINTNKQEWEDHLGNKYCSLNAMCRAYKISHHKFSTRLNKLGWTLEEALTTPSKIHAEPYTDYLGRTFPTCRDAANFYNVPVYIFQDPSKRKESFETTLRRAYKKNQLFGTMQFIKFVDFPYLEASKDNKTFVTDLETILEDYHNSEDFSPISKRKTKLDVEIASKIGFPMYRAIVDGEKRLCSYWQLIQYCYDNNYGLSEKKIAMKRRSVIYDHLGNKYKSLAEMLNAYNITYVPFVYRLEKLHMSFKDALTSPIACSKSTAIECTDHLGNTFATKADMCDYWHIPRATFFRRIKDGWSLEKALTKPAVFTHQSHQKKMWTDHEGNVFTSIDTMCAHWNITKRQYMINMKNNCSLKDALTTETELTVCRDHLGNEYPSTNAMCKHYGITKTTLRSRLELGWTLKEILEDPKQHAHGSPAKDHLGNEFPSTKAMLEYYDVNIMTFKHRLSHGKTLEEALTQRFDITPYTDHLGNKFATLKDMAKYWRFPTSTFHERRDKGLSIKDCITKINPKLNYGPGLEIIKILDSDYCEVKYKNKAIVWTTEQVFDYYRKTCLPNEGKDLIAK